MLIQSLRLTATPEGNWCWNIYCFNGEIKEGDKGRKWLKDEYTREILCQIPKSFTIVLVGALGEKYIGSNDALFSVIRFLSPF
jgi:hypothetical protein